MQGMTRLHGPPSSDEHAQHIVRDTRSAQKHVMFAPRYVLLGLIVDRGLTIRVCPGLAQCPWLEVGSASRIALRSFCAVFVVPSLRHGVASMCSGTAHGAPRTARPSHSAGVVSGFENLEQSSQPHSSHQPLCSPARPSLHSALPAPASAGTCVQAQAPQRKPCRRHRRGALASTARMLSRSGLAPQALARGLSAGQGASARALSEAWAGSP